MLYSLLVLHRRFSLEKPGVEREGVVSSNSHVGWYKGDDDGFNYLYSYRWRGSFHRKECENPYVGNYIFEDRTD